jgi:hypothetical protein
MFDRVHVPFHSNLAIWHVKPTVNRASSCLGRQVVGTYSKEARALALRLLEAISESLGLERSHMVKAMGRHAQHMALNYYPPCPQPELTYGLPGHKDPNAITLLLQDGVSGLQVQRDGRWVAVNPYPTRWSSTSEISCRYMLLFFSVCPAKSTSYRRSTSAILILSR